VAEAKTAVEEGKEQLEGMEDVDPSVSAAVFYVASLLYKATGDSAEFYRSRCVGVGVGAGAGMCVCVVVYMCVGVRVCVGVWVCI